MQAHASTAAQLSAHVLPRALVSEDMTGGALVTKDPDLANRRAQRVAESSELFFCLKTDLFALVDKAMQRARSFPCLKSVESCCVLCWHLATLGTWRLGSLAKAVGGIASPFEACESLEKV